MKGGDSNGRVSRDLDNFYHRSNRGSDHFIRARPQVGDEVEERTLQGGLIMNGTEALSFLALFILAVTMLLTDHMVMAIIAIIPLVATSFKYSFPQNVKKPSGGNR